MKNKVIPFLLVSGIMAIGAYYWNGSDSAGIQGDTAKDDSLKTELVQLEQNASENAENVKKKSDATGEEETESREIYSESEVIEGSEQDTTPNEFDIAYQNVKEVVKDKDSYLKFVNRHDLSTFDSLGLVVFSKDHPEMVLEAFLEQIRKKDANIPDLIVEVAWGGVLNSEQSETALKALANRVRDSSPTQKEITLVAKMAIDAKNPSQYSSIVEKFELKDLTYTVLIETVGDYWAKVGSPEKARHHYEEVLSRISEELDRGLAGTKYSSNSDMATQAHDWSVRRVERKLEELVM